MRGPFPRKWKVLWNLQDNLAAIERAILETDPAQFEQEALLLYPRLTKFGLCLPNIDVGKSNDQGKRDACYRLHLMFLKRLSREIRYKTFRMEEWNEDVTCQDNQSDVSRFGDEEAVRRTPGNGWRMIRVIMSASTVDEVDNLYSDYKSASYRTMEEEVFAAYGLKKIRLLRPSNREDAENLWWVFLEEAEQDGQLWDIGAALTWLEKEYPDD